MTGPVKPLSTSDTLDPMYYSSLFSPAERPSEDWFQPPSYYGMALPRSDDYLVSPTTTSMDGSMPVERDVLGMWEDPDLSLDNDNLFNHETPRTDSFTHIRASRTPSLCDDGEYVGVGTDSQPSTPSSDTVTKVSDTAEARTPAKRKRGRPRLIRNDSDSSYADATPRKTRISKRQPHNQVERKYREGLNAELERLRLAVPTLPQPDPTSSGAAPPKPSKATVLASAIDYIRKMELERDKLRRENEALKAGRRLGGGQRIRNAGWVYT